MSEEYGGIGMAGDLGEMRHRTEDDRDRGLYSKYLVVKRNTDRVVHNAFVLRYDDDPFAIPALRAYADACAVRYPTLAYDLRELADLHEDRQRTHRASVARIEKLEASCSFETRNQCRDDQEKRADPTFTCPVHGQAQDTLERLGIDVL